MEKQSKDLLSSIFRSCLLPIEKLPIDEWAEAYFRFPSNDPNAGSFNFLKAPFQRQILLSLGDPSVKEVSLQCSTQIGKTIQGLIALGYLIDTGYPSNIIMVFPNRAFAKDFSQDKVGRIFQDVPTLQNRLGSQKAKDGGNSLETKRIRGGGTLYFLSANNPANLAGRTAGVVILDEIDSYQIDRVEGNPVDLLKKRTFAFDDPRFWRFSSPKKPADHSFIVAAFQEGNQSYYEVPCPHCGHFQTLDWFNAQGELNLQWEPGHPETAGYACIECHSLIEEHHKFKILNAGRWVARCPEVKDHHSYYINSFYSSIGQASFRELAKAWDLAQENRHDEKVGIKAFLNTTMGLPFDPMILTAVKPQDLMDRREAWDAQVPKGVGILVAGVDVQGDRLEILVIGVGTRGRTFVIERKVFLGKPGLRDDVCWENLAEYLKSEFTHVSGKTLGIRQCFIDTGYATGIVHDNLKKMAAQGIRIFPAKGDSKPDPNRPYRQTKTGQGVANTTLISTSDYKDRIYSNLTVLDPKAPGCISFPEENWCNEDFFRQLVSEKRNLKVKNQPYENIQARNEVLDCFVYSLCAFDTLRIRRDTLESYIKELESNDENEVLEPQNEQEKPQDTQAKQVKNNPPPQRMKRLGWS